MLKKLLLFFGSGVLLFMIWFAIDNYRGAYPMAEEYLHGLALSLTAAVENTIIRDPSLHALSTFKTNDIAFFAIVDRNGLYRFHSNTDLIGTRVLGKRTLEALQNNKASASRITLGTRENAYEFVAPLQFGGEALFIRLVLHTYRANMVIRQAKLNMIILFTLAIVGVALSAFLYRFALREEQHRIEMARKESLVRLGELGATLAHEIRNPLAGIKGYAQVIEKNPSDPRAGSFAGYVVKEVLRLENLVGNLLAYAKTDTYSMELFELGELISIPCSHLQSEAQQGSIEILCDFPAGLQVYGNRDRLGQVLLNLGKNAIQAMPDGGIMRITAEISGTGVIITISDTGQGISPEDLPRIFEPFFTTKARGTGLGLSLCKKIIEEHRGKITVASDATKGTAFSIALPGPTGGRG